MGRLVAKSMVTHNNERATYARFYATHVPCDYCGELTRGRLHAGERVVRCGGCGRVIATAHHAAFEALVDRTS